MGRRSLIAFVERSYGVLELGIADVDGGIFEEELVEFSVGLVVKLFFELVNSGFVEGVGRNGQICERHNVGTVCKDDDSLLLRGVKRGEELVIGGKD